MTDVAPAGIPRLALHLVRLTLESQLKSAARMLGIGRPERIAIADLAPPQTPLTRAADEWAEEVCPVLFLDHGRRGYLFADAIGRHLRWSYDREILYLGCMLHDLGLAPRFDTGAAFERDGADAAAAFLSARGLSGARLRMLRDVIELHDAVHVAHRKAPEIALGHFGIGVDVIGYRQEDVHPGTISDIVDRHPRGDFRRKFRRVLEDQAARKPWSHIARCVRLGLGAKIEGAPVPDGEQQLSASPARRSYSVPSR